MGGRMSERDPRARRRPGRPPAGARRGERVRDYPQISLRVPEDVRAQLNALAAVTGQSRWRLLTHALECYLANLPARQRRQVQRMSGKRGR
jgi:LmbE family N-acetylglucosaminyl deacetylase